MPEQKPNESTTSGDDLPGLSSRSFLATTGTAGIVAALDAREIAGQTTSANPAEISDRREAHLTRIAG